LFLVKRCAKAMRVTEFVLFRCVSLLKRPDTVQNLPRNGGLVKSELSIKILLINILVALGTVYA